MVEALRYKPEGRGFDSRLYHCNFSFTWSGRIMALGLNQPLTEMSTRNISWGYRRPVRRADNLTTFICRLSWNLGASASWNHQGLSRPVTGSLLTINIPKSSKFWRISGAVRTSSSHKSSLVSSWTAFYIAICFDCKVIIIGNSNSTFKPHQFLAFIHYTVVRCC